MFWQKRKQTQRQQRPAQPHNPIIQVDCIAFTYKQGRKVVHNRMAFIMRQDGTSTFEDLSEQACIELLRFGLERQMANDPGFTWITQRKNESGFRWERYPPSCGYYQ